MGRFESAPHPLLRPYVPTYWGVSRDLSEQGGFTVTPDCFLELLFFVDPPLAEDAGGRRRQLPACTLIPLLREPLRLVTRGVVRCASARWYAWAAGLVLPSADSGAAAWHDAGPTFAGLIPAVRAALERDAWEEIPALLDGALLQTLADTPAAALPPATARAFVCPPDRTEAEGTGDVAARQRLSRRQVERQVRALTGSSPKQLASLTRFQFVRDTLWAQPRKELAALAFEAGYADQAHLTRHFRRYTGQTPGEFLRDCARLKAAMRGEDVAFLQDASRER